MSTYLWLENVQNLLYQSLVITADNVRLKTHITAVCFGSNMNSIETSQSQTVHGIAAGLKEIIVDLRTRVNRANTRIQL